MLVSWSNFMDIQIMGIDKSESFRDLIVFVEMDRCAADADMNGITKK